MINPLHVLNQKIKKFNCEKRVQTRFFNLSKFQKGDFIKMKSKVLSIETTEIQEKISQFIESDCVLEKAALLFTIKAQTKMCYIDLEGYLFCERRTLIRINSLNNLIPEILELIKTNVITKIIAYELASLSTNDQFEYFLLIHELSELKKIEARKSQRSIKKRDASQSITNKSRSQSLKYGALTGTDYNTVKTQFHEKEMAAVQ